MSFFARKRANKVRGLTIAERAFFKRISELHNQKNPEPFMGTKQLAYDHECSKIYARQVMRSLVAKRFLKLTTRRKALFDDDGDMRAFEIDFTRWFAYKNEEAERVNKRILGCFRRSVDDPQLAQGYLAAWLEPRRTRSKRKRQRIFIAVESQSHLGSMTEHLDKIRKELLEQFGGEFEIRYIEAFTTPQDGE